MMCVTSRSMLGILGILAALGVPGLGEAVQAGSSSLAGTVTSRDGVPVAGALVAVLGSDRAVRTDVRGRFVFPDLEAGTVVLRVQRVGFRPLEAKLEVEPGDDFVIPPGVIRLSTLAVSLPGVEVEGGEGGRLAVLELAGFYERREGGAGDFVARDQIDKWNPQSFSDILRRIPGVKVQPNPGYGRQRRAGAVGGVADTRRFVVILSRGGGGDCDPLLFVDGVYAGDLGTFDVDLLLADSEVAGVEIYRGPDETPGQFRLGGAACGVLVVWTR